MKEVTFRLNERVPSGKYDRIEVIVDGVSAGFVDCWASACNVAYHIACMPEPPIMQTADLIYQNRMPEELLNHKTDCTCPSCRSFFGVSRLGTLPYDDRNPQCTWSGYFAIWDKK